MIIYLYAFFVLGFLNSFKDIAIKHSLKKIDTGVLAGLNALFIVIFSLPFLYFEGIPSEFSPNFIWVLLFGGVFYYFGKYFNFTALSLGDISLISPMKGLVTISVVLTSFLLLGESVSFLGGCGIFLVIIGTYLLAIEKTHTNIFSPVKALWTNKGSRMYLICIFFYGFTVTLDRMGVLGSSIWFWSVCMNLFVLIFCIPDLYKNRKNIFHKLKEVYFSFFAILVLHFIVYISQMYIVSQILAPYTSLFKTSSALFAVLIGGRFFKEKGLVKRFISSIIILMGVSLVLFYG